MTFADSETAARPFVCSALVKTIPNLRKHRTQGAVSNLVSGGDAGLPWVLALQRRWCWREADAGSGLEERTAGPSELLEDRDSGCPCWAALGAGPSIRTLQSLQMSEPGDQITARSLESSTHRAQKHEGTVRSHAPPDPRGHSHPLATRTVEELLKPSQPPNW